MTDLDAIRARHVQGFFPSLSSYGPPSASSWETGLCSTHGEPWPCDTAIVLAALDAALAREARLREAAADVVAYWSAPSGGLTTGEHEQVVSMAALRAALAEPTP